MSQHPQWLVCHSSFQGFKAFEPPMTYRWEYRHVYRQKTHAHKMEGKNIHHDLSHEYLIVLHKDQKSSCINKCRKGLWQEMIGHPLKIKAPKNLRTVAKGACTTPIINTLVSRKKKIKEFSLNQEEKQWLFSLLLFPIVLLVSTRVITDGNK